MVQDSKWVSSITIQWQVQRCKILADRQSGTFEGSNSADSIPVHVCEEQSVCLISHLETKAWQPQSLFFAKIRCYTMLNWSTFVVGMVEGVAASCCQSQWVSMWLTCTTWGSVASCFHGLVSRGFTVLFWWHKVPQLSLNLNHCRRYILPVCKFKWIHLPYTDTGGKENVWCKDICSLLTVVLSYSFLRVWGVLLFGFFVCAYNCHVSMVVLGFHCLDVELCKHWAAPTDLKTAQLFFN